jgi:hypothetical protein
MLIFKEDLPVNTLDIRVISLPFHTAEEARKAIMKVESQYETPRMWYQVDMNNDCQEKEYCLLAIGTGHDWGSRLSKEEYIGTVLLYEGMLVLHYFLCEKIV